MRQSHLPLALTAAIHYNKMQDTDNLILSQKSETSRDTINEHSPQLPHLRNKTKRKKIIRTPLIVNLADCKYTVVKQVVKSMKMTSSKDSNSDWDLTWTDGAVSAELLARMKNYQKINHFPGMFQLSRKNYLARNIAKMYKKYPEQYNFHPRTWALPAQYSQLKTFLEQEGGVVISKPEAGCQGRGIFLSKNIEDFAYGQHYVVQKYIKRPFLIDGLKFDMRVYVLISGCDPLRVYVYQEGLVRFATEAYSIPKKDNLSNLFMHLTNYAINKASSKFEFNQSHQRMDVGHKRALTAVFGKLKQMGMDTTLIWDNICQVIVKTIISVQPILAHTYRSCQPDNLANNMCFQLLGFDVMLDHELKPVILEVNYTPSFSTDTPLDQLIKENLIKDTLKLLHLSNRAKSDAVAMKKRQMMQRTLTGKKVTRNKEEREGEIRRLAEKRDIWEKNHLGNFMPAYPPEQQNKDLREKYQSFLAYSQQCYLTNTGGNIKRQTKVMVPSQTVSEVNQVKTTQKYNRPDQLERIYMKKPKPMGWALKTRCNRSQVKDEKEGMVESKMETYQGRQFMKTKGYESVEKFGVWKVEPRGKTSEKGRQYEEGQTRGGTAKPSKSTISRVYNVAFRQMKATR